ncbi:MAG TPA: hypothetical protein ENG13_00765 [bacterium]|nr:hypothetical protein [bacterium]HEX67581.1 hypothetical protein [bacterium]
MRKSVIFVVVLAGIFLRGWGLGNKGLWLDESISFHYADPFHKTLLSLVREVREVDAHPPFYYLLLHGWLLPLKKIYKNRLIIAPCEVVGEGYLRFPSFLFASLSILMFWLVERELKGKGWGTLFFSLSAYHIYYAQEARLYSLVALFSLLSLFFLLRAENMPLYWIPLTLIWCFSLYTYIFFLFFIIALDIWWWFGRKRKFLPWFLSHVFLILSFLPYLPFVIRRLMTLPTFPVKISFKQKILSFISVPLNFSLGEVLPFPLSLKIFLFLLILFFLFFPFFTSLTRRERLPFFGFFLPFFLLPFLPYRSHIFNPKFLIFSFPCVFLIFSLSLKKMRKEGRWLLIALLVIGNAVSFSLYRMPSLQKERWRDCTKWVVLREKEKEIVIFNPSYVGYAFDFYYRGKLERRGFIHDSALKDIEKFSGVFLIENLSPVAFPSSKPSQLLKKNFLQVEAEIFPGYTGLIRVSLWRRKDLK